MTTLLLAILGWCLLSVVTATGLAAVCAGARKGAEMQRRAAQHPARMDESMLVPVPRAALQAEPVAT